jgi:hypothetical protein
VLASELGRVTRRRAPGVVQLGVAHARCVRAQAPEPPHHGASRASPALHVAGWRS